jgi:small subunit ribosomal protein S9
MPSQRRPVYKQIIKSGIRKTAKATATIRAGVGRVRVNGIPVEICQPEVAREVMLTPLNLAGELRDHVDVDVAVKGGGFMGQAYAVAMAISRALVRWFEDYKPNPNIDLKSRILAYDRHLLVGDPRQKEPKKFARRGARRRPQKSYR